MTAQAHLKKRLVLRIVPWRRVCRRHCFAIAALRGSSKTHCLSSRCIVHRTPSILCRQDLGRLQRKRAGGGGGVTDPDHTQRLSVARTAVQRLLARDVTLSNIARPTHPPTQSPTHPPNSHPLPSRSAPCSLARRAHTSVLQGSMV